jgi:hypothetical protein
MPESAYSAKDTVENKSAGTFFLGGKGGPAFFQQGMVQRKCAGCEAEDSEEKEEKKIQRQEVGGESPHAADTPYVITGADPVAAPALPPFGLPGKGSHNPADGVSSVNSSPLLPLKLPIDFKLQVSQPDDPYEREADAAAEKVVQGRSASVNFYSAGVQKKCAHCDAEEKEAHPIRETVHIC